MGRLPKGFKKTLNHKHEDQPEEGEADAPAPVHVEEKAHAKASTSHATKEQHSKPAPPAHEDDGSGGSDGSDGDGDKGPETKGKMLQRHKRVGFGGVGPCGRASACPVCCRGLAGTSLLCLSPGHHHAQPRIPEGLWLTVCRRCWPSKTT